MWTFGGLLTAASDVTAPAGANDSLIAAIGGIVVAALGALGLVLAEVVRGRNAHTTSSPPDPQPAPGPDVVLYERTAVLSDRADDSDLRDDVQDRALNNHGDRIEALERWAGRHDPDGWRHG